MKKINLFVLFLVAQFSLLAQSNVANFVISSPQSCAGEEVLFTDMSTTIDSTVTIIDRLWNFGDGNTSNEQDPSHTYFSEGSYTVGLTIMTSDGDTNFTSQFIDVGLDYTQVSFSLDNYFGCEIPLVVSVIDIPLNAMNPIYSWDFGNGNTSTEAFPTIQYTAAGNYTITLTLESNGCVGTYSDEVTVSPIFVEFLNPQFSICSNGDPINLNNEVTQPGGDFFINNSLVENGIFDPSNYNDTTDVFVEYIYTDNNGCQATDMATIFLSQPAAIDLDITNSSCGENNGGINAIVSGANGNFVSFWNNGAQNTTTIVDLAPGSYTLTVIDDATCIATKQGNVGSSDLIIAGTTVDPSCHNGSDGSITLAVNGAGSQFNYLWSNGANTSVIQNRRTGIYDVIVTDENGCTATESFVLNNPAPFTANYAVDGSTCGNSDGNIFLVNYENGSTPYSHVWSNGANSANLNNVSNGNYSVIITDGNNCQFESSYLIQNTNGPSASAQVTRSSCEEPTGAIQVALTPSTGSQIESIIWSNSETTPSISQLTPGSYSCVVTQIDGCQSNFSWNVGIRPPAQPEICIVTVDSLTTTNLVVWEKEETNTIDYYNIYRESSQNGVYQVVGRVSYEAISVFNDVVASPVTKSWRYRISAVNDCGIESPLSTRHKTIHLVKNELANGDVSVSWDNYEGFNYTDYDLWRFTDSEGWELIQDNIPYTAIPNFLDTPPSLDGLDYMIEVMPPGGVCTATFGKAQDYNTTRSNKSRGIFNPGEGTGDPSNTLTVVEENSYALSLYPNPTNGRFILVLTELEGTHPQINTQVINSLGKVVHQTNVASGENHINLEGEPSGMYFIKVNDGTKVQVLKLMIN